MMPGQEYWHHQYRRSMFAVGSLPNVAVYIQTICILFILLYIDTLATSSPFMRFDFLSFYMQYLMLETYNSLKFHTED